MVGMKPENIHIDDVREEFVRDFVFPMFRANALYEGQYLLGTSIARPLIAKRLIEIAKQTGADAIAHGATGKGNDQVRFDPRPPRADTAQCRCRSQNFAGHGACRDYGAIDARTHVLRSLRRRSDHRAQGEP